VIPFGDSLNKKEKSVLAYSPKKLVSSSEAIATALTNIGPKPKIIKENDDGAFGAPSPNRAPKTSNNLDSRLNKLQSSRRASLKGQVDDDANSVAQSLSRLQRFMALSSSAKAQDPANVMVKRATIY
jgi:hypothetical protein